jgi:hypothetical protein
MNDAVAFRECGFNHTEAFMKLFAAREEDAHQGWVWLQNNYYPPRSVVKIKNPLNGRSVCCEVLQIDKNFLERYNKPPRASIINPSEALVIGAWYRAQLGEIQSQSEVPLEVSACNSWWGKFRACSSHPQIVVRLSVWLGGTSLVLGIIGLVLGVISICLTKT